MDIPAEVLSEFQATGFPDVTPEEWAEIHRVLRRFPSGYGLMGQVVYFRGQSRPYAAELVVAYKLTRIPCGTFADHVSAHAATVPIARSLVAAKLRELRKLPRPPFIPTPGRRRRKARA